jgi:hypothetical protein
MLETVAEFKIWRAKVNRFVAAVVGMVTVSFVAGGSVAAHAYKFSFRGVEFMPRDQREPAARAFVAQHAAPGASMNAAIDAIKMAGAHCSYSVGTKDAIVCTASSLQRHPGEDLTDIQWKVIIFPSANGTVDHTAVVRTRSGL